MSGARATRLYFESTKKEVIEREIEFDYHRGFAPAQKIKNRDSLHKAIKSKNASHQDILEISTKSNIELGRNLSAFNLKLDGKPLEIVFQGSKRFKPISKHAKVETEGFSDFIADDCNNDELYFDFGDSKPRDSKKMIADFLEKNKRVCKLCCFKYKGERFELSSNLGCSKSFFYDYIYFKALQESLSKDELRKILDYSIFTDIEFNQKKSINCQARSVALYHYALSNNKVDFFMSPKGNFLEIYKIYKYENKDGLF